MGQQGGDEAGAEITRCAEEEDFHCFFLVGPKLCDWCGWWNGGMSRCCEHMLGEPVR